MTNDDPKITDFMKNASVDEILSNAELWGEDLIRYKDGVNKYVDM